MSVRRTHDPAGVPGGATFPAPPGPGPQHCPIQALHDEHFRQRALCQDMEVLAATKVPRPELARAILINLCRDLPLHHADEDDSLLPRLRARARPADDIGQLIARLDRDHRAAEAALPDLVVALSVLADGALPAPEDRSRLVALARAQLRHMILENAVLLPLARSRLTVRDRAAIRDEMRARRSGAGGTPSLSVDKSCARALARLAGDPDAAQEER